MRTSGFWYEVKKTDKRAIALADRHYSRQKPGSRELGPPGQKILLLTDDERAVWGSHRPAPWSGAKRSDGWEGHSCFLFRNERAYDGEVYASALIREAVALTALSWGLAPFLTYIAIEAVGRHQPTRPGYSYEKAGFHPVSCSREVKKGMGHLLRMEMELETVESCVCDLLSSPGEIRLEIHRPKKVKGIDY